MSTSPIALEDPLIAALPPNTDYITYLTILEYHLTPKNLSTLNKLLRDDDGTLASEIGWDLLKLVLPILRVEPDKVRECLDLISRRGNPREVIIRVSEELESLGVDEEEDAELDTDPSDDGLPTFTGEAPRVHLGDMTLAGMPPPRIAPSRDEESQHDQDHAPDRAIEELKLQSLLSMLSSLHPRIKTQYPSRFLATSLPAALGAYRRLNMNTESTLSFLNTLAKLHGRKRPALPPRTPTAELLTKTLCPSDPNTVAPAPLPDPESNTEFKSQPKEITDAEAAINKRLLQAVLLEIIDEHTTGSSEAQPPLTTRLRARYQPQSIRSNKREELEDLLHTEEAIHADAVRRKFVSTCKDLEVDVPSEITTVFQPPASDVQDEEEHEYPTSPSQIPFSTTGLLLLSCMQDFDQAKLKSSHSASLPTSMEQSTNTLQLIMRQYHVDSRLRQSAPALDYILARLYIAFCISTFSARTESDPATSTSTMTDVFALLKDVFTTCPDPDLRDNAHYIATRLIHCFFSVPSKIQIITRLVSESSSFNQDSAFSAIHEAQIGNIKATAVNWLKDEVYPTQAILAIIDSSPKAEMGAPLQSSVNSPGKGLPVTVLLELSASLFPIDTIPATPSSGSISANPGNADSTQDTTTSVTLEIFSANLPFYISLLNLSNVFLRNSSHEDEAPYPESTFAAKETPTESEQIDTSKDADRAPVSTQTTTLDLTAAATGTISTSTTLDNDTGSQPKPKFESLMTRISAFLIKMEEWNTYLTGRLAITTTQDHDTTGAESLQKDGIALSDLFALEDAVSRTRDALSVVG